MPTMLLVPHPRLSFSKSQVSFLNIARLIYLLSFLGQAKPILELGSVVRESDVQVTRNSIKLLKSSD